MSKSIFVISITLNTSPIELNEHENGDVSFCRFHAISLPEECDEKFVDEAYRKSCEAARLEFKFIWSKSAIESADEK